MRALRSTLKLACARRLCSLALRGSRLEGAVKSCFLAQFDFEGDSTAFYTKNRPMRHAPPSTSYSEHTRAHSRHGYRIYRVPARRPCTRCRGSNQLKICATAVCVSLGPIYMSVLILIAADAALTSFGGPRRGTDGQTSYHRPPCHHRPWPPSMWPSRRRRNRAGCPPEVSIIICHQ